MDNGLGSWTVLASEVVFQKWIAVMRDRLRKPDGTEMDYHYLKSGGSASVLAFTDDDQVVLTQQYRHPLRQVIYDLPAGGIHEGESPQEAARRELSEETGYRAGEIELLGHYSPLPGTIAHTCHVFVARGLEAGTRHPDEHELVEVVLKPWNRVVELVLAGAVVDGSLVYAVLRYLARTR